MELLTLSNGGKTGELMIYDDIGYDLWSDGGVTAIGVHEALARADKLEELTVRINSPGGSVRDGNSIYNELHRHAARVIVSIDSLAASAASVIAMAGDEIHIAKNGLVMIHEASGGARGRAKDLETTAKVLRKISESAADVYQARTGRSKEEILQWMADETWMTADEAFANGFVTKVLPAKTAPALTPEQRARGERMLSTFDHPPEAVIQMFARTRRAPDTVPPPNMTTAPREPSQGAPPAIVPTALGRLATEARGVMRLGNL